MVNVKKCTGNNNKELLQVTVMTREMASGQETGTEYRWIQSFSFSSPFLPNLIPSTASSPVPAPVPARTCLQPVTGKKSVVLCRCLASFVIAKRGHVSPTARVIRWCPPGSAPLLLSRWHALLNPSSILAWKSLL
ncbi:hypothetical protein E2C01_025947 [Portunus trituberculatus]|uniref:Uncharacterized protein n=1 Tax=Portunus trituberculatus TaxID=210409 RepID=A0A5B7EGW1_PORTR|nr:hypothetical protein [Portunus trituberculatus]